MAQQKGNSTNYTCLTQSDGDGGSGHEAPDHGMAQELHQPTLRGNGGGGGASGQDRGNHNRIPSEHAHPPAVLTTRSTPIPPYHAQHSDSGVHACDDECHLDSGLAVRILAGLSHGGHMGGHMGGTGGGLRPDCMHSDRPAGQVDGGGMTKREQSGNVDVEKVQGKSRYTQ